MVPVGKENHETQVSVKKGGLSKSDYKLIPIISVNIVYSCASKRRKEERKKKEESRGG